MPLRLCFHVPFSESFKDFWCTFGIASRFLCTFENDAFMRFFVHYLRIYFEIFLHFSDTGFGTLLRMTCIDLCALLG